MSDDYRKSKGDKLLYCSFCGKSQHEVRKLIAGPSVFVCDECVELCNDIIRDESEELKDKKIIREKSEELKDKTWEKVLLSPLHPLADAISILGQAGNIGIVLVVGEDRKLLGTITDGDARRALVANKKMWSPLEGVMNRSPVVVQDESKLPVIQKLCKAGNVTRLPILDQRHRVVGLAAVYGGEKNREGDIVLIVVDDPNIRSVVSEILRNEGLEVETAENVDVAREKFNKLTPDLVLVDIGMTDTAGMTLLKEWKTAENAPPIVITSAYSTVATAVEYVRAGAYDFIEKPFSIEKLLTTVREALKSHT